MARITIPGEKQCTASILAVTQESPKRILLVHHKKYDLWIQPGGHMEKFENPVEAVVRETKEETGIDVGFLLGKIKKIDELASFLPIPDFFLEEKIAPHGQDPAHVHLDLLYQVEIPYQEVKRAEKESHDIGWFTPVEALRLPMYKNTRVIIQRIFQK